METFVLRGEKNEPSYDLVRCIKRRFGVEVKNIKLDFPDYGVMYTYYDKRMNLELNGVKNVSPFLILNGSGHYHQRTYFILKALGKKCSYLHVDAHSDTGMNENEMVGCGSFVLSVVDLPNVECAYLVGVKITSDEKSEPLHVDYPVTVFGPSNYADFDLDEFSVESIKGEFYLSVDLDVTDEILTDFSGNGTMSFSELCKLCEDAVKSGRLIGADICGLADMRRFNNAKRYKKSLEMLVDLYDVFRKV